ncbi:MAG: biotin--[acetyl-CoA-carboxylase] ligase [bacterium]
MYNYEHELKHRLGSLNFLKEIIYFSSIESTNTKASELALKGYDEWTVIVADTQSKGKGRQNRNWYSPPGVNIYTSLIVKPNISYKHIPSLSLLAGLIVAFTIEHFTGMQPTLKWPNDVLVNKKKISGILLELFNNLYEKHGVVVGIGINVNSDVKDYPDQLSQLATSMMTLTNKPYDRVEILVYLYSTFYKWYNVYCANDGFNSIKEQYMQRFEMLNRYVKIINRDETITGTVRDIDEYGRLVLEKDDGKLMNINSGDVHIM